jgi:predicted membrane protein
MTLGEKIGTVVISGTIATGIFVFFLGLSAMIWAVIR